MLELTLLLLALLAGQWAFGRVPPLRGARGSTSGGRLRVVIPARNEEASLANLLADLAASRPVGCEVVVVDDGSTDATAGIARGFDFVELRSAPPLPPGWAGKPWACHHGSRDVYDGDLVFVDADVRLAPGALDAVTAALSSHGGLVSVVPSHVVRRWWEGLSALFNVVAVMGSGAGRRRPWGAFGPVIAMRAVDYRALGGHAAVAGEVVEDLALAGRVRAAGLPVQVYSGGSAVGFRMYPTGVRALLEGWTKNIASGAGGTPLPSLAAIVAWITALVTVSARIAGVGDAPLWAAALAATAVVVQLMALFRLVGTFHPATALAFPLLVAFFLMVFFRSAYRTLVRHSVVWRGREIGVR